MTNLKQCPFCGGEAERIDIPAEHDDIENAGASCIQCSRCVASTALHFDRKENLESSWNDRKPTYIGKIAEEARRYAGFYPQSSDARNTFVMFAEWVDSLAGQNTY